MKEFLRKEKIIIKLQKDQKYKEDRIGNLKRKLGNLNRKVDLLSKLFIKSHSIIFVFLEVENGESNQKYKNDRIGNLIGKISDLNGTINGLSELFFKSNYIIFVFLDIENEKHKSEYNKLMQNYRNATKKDGILYNPEIDELKTTIQNMGALIPKPFFLI